MSEVQALLRHYVEVRNRLRRPPNAVPDTGINLRRGREEPIQPEPTEEPKPEIKLTTKEVKNLQNYKTSFCRKDLTFKNILRFVADEHGLTLNMLMSKRRTAPIVLPRQIAFWLASKHLSQSLSSMGKYLGLDHTSVLHGRNKIAHIVVGDTDLAAKIKDLEVKLLAHFNRSPIPAFDQCFVALQSRKGSQVRPIFSVDNSSRPASDDPEEGPDQDVEGPVHSPTTAILEGS